MNWKAAGDNIVVRVVARPTQTESGIILVDKMKVAVDTGIVLAAGPEAKGVMPGDIVFFDVKGATKILDGVVSIQVTDALAINREED